MRFLLPITVLAIAPTLAPAQGRLSEKGIVAQTVGNTTVTVEYFRPVARGRDSVFGRVVRWGEHWTPGANWATTIDVDRDVRVEGKLLPKGKYSLWTIVQPDTWSVTFNRTWRRFHLNRPDGSDEQIRVAAHPEPTPHTEVMTFDFPQVTTGAATLRLRWGTLAVPLHVTMIAPPLVPVPKALRATYVGRYDVEVLPLTDDDSTRHLLINITDEDDGMHWRDVEGRAGGRRDFILSPGGPDHEFLRAQRSADGQWWTQSGITIDFAVEKGRATGFEVHVDDTVLASRARRMR